MLIALVSTIVAVQAATWTVNADGSGDLPTIQDAIDAAADGDTIVVSAGTYDQTVVIASKSVVLQGAGSTETILHGGGLVPTLINIHNSSNTTVTGFGFDNLRQQGLWIENSTVEVIDLYAYRLGNDYTMGGVIKAWESTLDVRDSEFVNNGGADGGAIYVTGQSDVTVSNSVFNGNSAFGYYGEDDVDAPGDGGAIYVRDEGTLTVFDCTFEGNTGFERGGAIYARTLDGTVDVRDSRFEGNRSLRGRGGAIGAQMHTADTEELETFGEIQVDVNIVDCSFENNIAYGGDGGALAFSGHYEAPANATVSQCDFIGNSSGRGGGALHAGPLFGDLVISDLQVEENYAGYGGGLYLVSGVLLDMDRITMIRNTATSSGGGAYFATSIMVDMDDCVFEGNNALGTSGGGLYANNFNSTYPMTVHDTRFSDNSSGYEGGGLYLKSVSNATLSRVVFEGNEAGSGGGSFGGGLFTDDSAYVKLRNALVRSNSATYGGGAYINDNADGSDFYNNVFLDNYAETGGGLALCNSPFSIFYNNTVAGNVAYESAGMALVESQVEFRNNIFAHNRGGSALHIYDLNSFFYADWGYNDFYANDPLHLAGEVIEAELLAADNNMEIDPQFATYESGMPGDEVSLVLARTSTLIDAGDPLIWDPDGSRSDVGAYGGRELNMVDLDGDGFSNLDGDCDDDDPTVYPYADDAWYDGVNSDCMPGSDHDADGDGEDASSGSGTDCDDTDPERTAPEDCAPPTDTGDPGDGGSSADEDGKGGGTIAGQGCGCSARPNGAPGFVWLLGLLAFRRRP